MKDTSFKFEMLPGNWALCFNRNCAQSNKCMRFFAAQSLPTQNTIGYAVYPNAQAQSGCTHFVEKRLVKLAYGFRGLLDDIKVKDQTTLRYALIGYFGCRSTYYRYLNDKQALLPEQQTDLAEIFRAHGYTEELVFDEYAEHYAFV